MKMKLLAVLFGLSGFGLSAYATMITGAGSTFVYPALSVWANNYAQATGTQINYQAIGSAGGIAQIKAGTVSFAATDKPLDAADLSASHFSQFPLVKGEIVVTENLPINQTLILDGPTIANIYLGQIKYWDDPAIQKLNPGVALPHKAITPIYRADGSGTTYNFTHYLASISPTFNSKIGSDTVVSWPAGVGAKGNAGVANFVKTIPGAMGYVEYAYAKENNLAIAKTPKLIATTYIVMPQQGPDNQALNAFFQYCFAHSEVATQLNYLPIKGK